MFMFLPIFLKIVHVRYEKCLKNYANEMVKKMYIDFRLITIREHFQDLDEYEVDLETDKRIEYDREDDYNVQIIKILRKKVRN